MASFLQIMIYMLCVYFIFKGVEILQIRLANQTDTRRLGVTIGVLAVVAAVAAAVAFFVFEEYVAKEFGDRMNHLPGLNR